MSGAFVLDGLALLAAVVLALLAREALRLWRAVPPREVREQCVGTAAATDATLPRVIWTYWHDATPPEFVALCLANWRRLAPDHALRLLDRRTLHDWIPAAQLRADFDALPAYRQADWLRIQLLARHGGVWIDASTLLCRDLGWLHALRARHGAEYAGFYIARYTNRPERPHVENWFMAAVPGSAFARDLAAAFDAALDLGAEALLERLRAEGRIEAVVQDLTEDFQRYLLMHVAASDLLDRDAARYRLALQRAEDTAFAFHAALGWRKRHLYGRLAILPCPPRLPALVKLRGGDRRVFEQGLARGRWRAGSALARLLELRR
ncbi:MAG: hypothetical protein JO224_03350 [Pelomonas sp.]|nr:hypothetical protein [Roseateles sp.]